MEPELLRTKSDFGNNTVLNLAGNLIIGVPIGGTHGAGVRPYVVGGVGLISGRRLTAAPSRRQCRSETCLAGTRAAA
jgi:hypothetical protein